MTNKRTTPTTEAQHPARASVRRAQRKRHNLSATDAKAKELFDGFIGEIDSVTAVDIATTDDALRGLILAAANDNDAPGVSAFDELAAFDGVANGGNGDGFITADDDVFESLRVWRDLDQDGVTDAGELFTLADVDIVSIDIAGTALGHETPQGTLLREQGTFTRGDGSTGDSYEAIFETSPTDTVFRGERGLPSRAWAA